MPVEHGRDVARDAITLAIAHATLAAIVLASGFDHVSDDDFARVTIAEAFADAPRLDPSGTSWLPFPFWWIGGAMAVFGRRLVVARVASVMLASLAAALPYVALRRASVPRAHALGGVAFAFLSPWPLWLGAATVPESFTASATAAAAVALALPRGSLAFAALLGAACLSRYEAWPTAAVLAATLACRARAGGALGRRTLACAALAAAAPLAWMLWNLACHGSPIHFFHRVSSFKRAIGAGSTDAVAALLYYPRLLAATRPALVLTTAMGLLAMRDPVLRRRWSVPLVCAAAELALLALGNARDGAPAHHPERALLGITFLLAPFSVDACATIVMRWRSVAARASAGALIVALSAWTTIGGLGSPPGASPAEDRRPQLGRGAALRARGARSLTIEPCAFEHFALLAAYGSPEDAEVLPRTDTPVTPDCPRVLVR